MSNWWDDAPIAAAENDSWWKMAPMAPTQSGLHDALDWADRNIAESVNKAVNIVGSNFAKGLAGIAGMPGDVRNLGNTVAGWLGAKLGDPNFAKDFAKVYNPVSLGGGVAPSSAQLNQATFSAMPEAKAADVPGLKAGPVNFGSAIDAGLQAIPSMAVAGAPQAIPAFTGGAASDLAGQATKGMPYEIPARILGGIPGYYAGIKLTTPLPAHLTPEQQRLVDLAKSNPYLRDTLTIGQETGRGRGVESAIARFPTSQGRMAANADVQNRGLVRTALAEAGAEGERLDPTSMTAVNQKASDAFEAAKNASGNVTLDKPFFQKLNDVVTRYLDLTPQSNMAPIVGKKSMDFVDIARSGTPELTGPQYQAFRKSINDAAYEASNPDVKNALKGMREGLDDAMQRSVPAEQAAAWNTVRKNWAALKILNRAAAGGSVESRASGNLSPSALTMALRSRQGYDQFATKTGGLNDVARLAGYLADTRPNSGTPQTLAMQGLLTGSPIAAGYATAGGLGALGAAGMMALPNIAARVTTGAPGFGLLRSYLANQALPNQGLQQLPQSVGPGMFLSLPPHPALPERRP